MPWTFHRVPETSIEETLAVLQVSDRTSGSRNGPETAPTFVTSVADAFATFHPAIRFGPMIGYKADLRFDTIADFAVSAVCSRRSNRQNDIAHLHDTIVDLTEEYVNRPEKPLGPIYDELLTELYSRIRPLEQSYRAIELFFENARVGRARFEAPVSLHIVDATPEEVRSEDLGHTPLGQIVQRYIKEHARITALVVPGDVGKVARTSWGNLSAECGTLLITDVSPRGQVGELLSDIDPGYGIALVSRFTVRDAHWFELTGNPGRDREGLSIPGSLLYAGACVRFLRILSLDAGIRASTFRPLEARAVGRGCFELWGEEEMDLHFAPSHIVAVGRDDNHQLCFKSQTSQKDPGLFRRMVFLRTCSSVERDAKHIVQRFVGRALNRREVDDLLGSIREPLRGLNRNRSRWDPAIKWSLDCDYDYQEGSSFDVRIRLAPAGGPPPEEFLIHIGSFLAG